MDWSAIGHLVAPFAPTIGSILGGLIPFPGGSVLGQAAGKIVAEALGVPPTPEAINKAITTGDPAVIQAKLSEAETRMQAEVDKFKTAVADVQDARHVGLEYVKAGSAIKWTAGIVSVVVTLGFVGVSYMAITKPVGLNNDVLMYLLGAWNSAFMTVLAYWLGSSAGSAEKTDQIAALAGKPPPKK